jgi:chromosome segregation ATPase
MHSGPEPRENMTRKESVTLRQILDKLTSHDTQFDKISTQFDKISVKLIAHDKQFENGAKQIFSLEDSFKKEFRMLEERIQGVEGTLEKQSGDLEKLSQEYHMITVALKRVESSVETNSSFRVELDAMKGRMSSMENRILSLEAGRG